MNLMCDWLCHQPCSKQRFTCLYYSCSGSFWKLLVDSCNSVRTMIGGNQRYSRDITHVYGGVVLGQVGSIDDTSLADRQRKRLHAVGADRQLAVPPQDTEVRSMSPLGRDCPCRSTCRTPRPTVSEEQPRDLVDRARLACRPEFRCM